MHLPLSLRSGGNLLLGDQLDDLPFIVLERCYRDHSERLLQEYGAGTGVHLWPWYTTPRRRRMHEHVPCARANPHEDDAVATARMHAVLRCLGMRTTSCPVSLCAG